MKEKFKLHRNLYSCGKLITQKRKLNKNPVIYLLRLSEKSPPHKGNSLSCFSFEISCTGQASSEINRLPAASGLPGEEELLSIGKVWPGMVTVLGMCPQCGDVIGANGKTLGLWQFWKPS